MGEPGNDIDGLDIDQVGIFDLWHEFPYAFVIQSIQCLSKYTVNARNPNC